MIYFNGFSLKNVEELFKEYTLLSDTTVVGFSFGAQKALEYVYQTKKRVDRLILLSPAFFQTQKPSFIRTQLRYFESNKNTYIEQFLSNVSYPSTINLSKYLHEGSKEELELLLTYQWENSKIQKIINQGTNIEVFLGEKDKIIPMKEALNFFSTTTTYVIKDAGHLLKGIA